MPEAAKTFYTSKTPYHPFQDLTSYSEAPAGYVPVFVEHVARHGSRLLSSKKYDDLAYQLWEEAEKDGGLTTLGQTFGPEALKMTAVNEELGYGSLSGLGATEHGDMARRVFTRQQQFFEAAAKDGEHIQIVTSGNDRAVDSGANFADALEAASSSLKGLVDEPKANEDLLYFHKAAANAGYQEYVDSDPRVKAAIKSIEKSEPVNAAARDMLEQIFTTSFVDRLAAGEFDFVDHGKGTKHLKDVASAADSIYNLYLIAPGMKDEGDWDFEKFVPAKDAEQLAYLLDAQDFYEKGPGFEGDDITYKMADVLLDDFFAQIQQKVDGTSKLAGDFRFAHAEIIFPFATLLGLEGSTKQAAEGEIYTYGNNPWRGETVAPMAANVQWDVYKDANNNYAVRMLYNEKEVSFKNGCEPLSPGSFFYSFDGLKECYGQS